jgi:hypothetical protein
MKFSSIRRFGDRTAVLLRQTVIPAMRQVPYVAAHPDATYLDSVTVYDCKQPASVSAEETLLSAGEDVLHHYKWGDPRYVDFALGGKLEPGSVGFSARSIACYQETTIPSVTKSQLEKMDFESLASLGTGEGELFYKLLPAKRDTPNEKLLLFITKYYNDPNVPLLPDTSIPNWPKYRTAVDTAKLNCKARRMFSFVNEFYNSANELVFLRPPIPIPEDVNNWPAISEKPSPPQLHYTECS